MTSRCAAALLMAIALGGVPAAGAEKAGPSTAAATAAATATAAAPAPGALGVSYGGWRGEYRNAPERLAAFKEIGFRVVAFVPTYAYVGLDRIDLQSGPDADELAHAVEAALRAGFAVVIKPHLDPPIYGPGFDMFGTDNHSWRVHCAWRGFFDVDPMSDAYRNGIVVGALRMLKKALTALPAPPAAQIRLELGAELMNAEVNLPERWLELLAAARKERHHLGLDGSVVLSHNFTHHFEILDDFVGRMSSARRGALRRYIRGLDALSLSQYMDLTVAVPGDDRSRRLPTAEEVARALVVHERTFREEILERALGLRAAEIPPLHIGEFGVGRGGLRHPNLWAGEATAAQEKELAREIALGHEGLVRYLAAGEGRTARSAILWVTGAHYDIFGWENPRYANPAAAAAVRAGLRPAAGP